VGVSLVGPPAVVLAWHLGWGVRCNASSIHGHAFGGEGMGGREGGGVAKEVSTGGCWGPRQRFPWTIPPAFRRLFTLLPIAAAFWMLVVQEGRGLIKLQCAGAPFTIRYIR
jgi:hypothetical protein